MEVRRYEDLTVHLCDSRAELGQQVAEEFAKAIHTDLETADETAIIVATGNSQLPFVEALARRDDIPWNRIRVFHMDEYLGMDAGHTASFRRWLQEKIVEPFQPLEFFGIDGDHQPIEEETARYTELLERYRPSVVVMGIGENGHLAFNDPPADFDTPDLVRVVDLDEACRNQQVGEGHFPSLGETPTQAVSLSIPALLRPDRVLVGVPEQRKAAAVKAALTGPVTPDCPASKLQEVAKATVFLDPESASLL